jgi:hypothetical protein
MIDVSHAFARVVDAATATQNPAISYQPER